MRDSLTSSNHRDFGARYSQTFGWLVTGEKKQFVYLQEVEDSRIYFTINNSSTRFHARMDAGVMFEFLPVNHGWFNTDDHQTYLLQRVPARQWKRGISIGNTQVGFLDLPGARNEPTFDVLERIFSSKVGYSSPITSRGAISKHFAINKAGNVLFYNTPVGVYDPKGVIKLDNSLVRQELTDLLRRRGESNIVVEVKDNG
jgi:hypothetical protein